jgi:hypothetical protein
MVYSPLISTTIFVSYCQCYFAYIIFLYYSVTKLHAHDLKMCKLSLDLLKDVSKFKTKFDDRYVCVHVLKNLKEVLIFSKDVFKFSTKN